MKFALILLLAIGASAEMKTRDLSHVLPISAKFLNSDNPLMGFLPQASRQERITGGEIVTPGDHPYQVATFITAPGGTYFCGGSIIAPNLVLSAAHCAIEGIYVEIIAGAHNIRNFEPNQQSITVSRDAGEIVVHERYDPSAINNDIALYRLPRPFTLNQWVTVLRLPALSDNRRWAEEFATVSGWGRASDRETAISDYLRAVTVEVKSNLACNTWWVGLIGSSKVCCKGSDRKSACNGDSGGPLVVTDTDGELLQLGLVSFGLAAGCELGFPHVYTRVSSYVDWIAANSDYQPQP